MRKQILLFGFGEERTKVIKAALFVLKIPVVPVSVDDYESPLGAVAGIKEFGRRERTNAAVLSDEMLVMCGLDNTEMDKLLRLLRKSAPVRYKAVLTPYNARWDAFELLEAIKAEAANFGDN